MQISVKSTGVLLSVVLGFSSAIAVAKFKDVLPTQDAHIASQLPTTVLSGGTNTSVFFQKGGATTTYGDQHTWLQFNLSNQIPASASISRASVRFYVNFDDNFNADLPVRAVGVDDGWSETDLTWNTAAAMGVLDATPAVGDQLSEATLELGQRYRWYELDVTDFVQNQLSSDPGKVVSLAIEVAPAAVSLSEDINFRATSKDYLPSGEVAGTFAPRLRIEYSGDWPSSANDITIIHTNDIHSRLNTHELDFPDADGEAPALEEAGGAAYVAAKVLELKQAHPNALMIDAGDISEGSPLGDLRGNGGTVDFFQILNTHLLALGGRGIDGIVVGNHDVREASMLENMRDPNGNGVINGWVDTNNDGSYDTFNGDTADSQDVPYLAVNLTTKSAAVPAPADWPIALPYKPFNLISLPDGTVVAVLGYLTDDSAILTSETEPLIEIKETVWSDSDSSTVDLRDWVQYLRNTKGADVVVLLSHIGHRRLNATTQPLLGADSEVAGPDVVVSGHWHTWTRTAWQPSNLNYQTTNVEAASYGQYVGELTLTPEGRYLSANKHAMKVADINIPASGPVKNVFDDVNTLLADLETEYNNQTAADAEHDPCILVENGAMTEAQVQAQFPAFNSGDNCPLNLVVAQSSVDLYLDKDKWNTLSEFPWSGDNTAGGWITDAMVWKVRQLGLPSGADLAFQTGGGIRRDLAAGDLTYREIYEAYPWDDDGMVRVQLTSQQVVDFIEDAYVGASISGDWQVTATDGQIDAVEVDTNGDGNFDTTLNRADTATQWQVIISEYMYEHESWISETSGSSTTFKNADATPEYINSDGTTSSSLSTDPLEIRNSVIEYSHATSPVTVKGPRYLLNTEIAGQFEAVITMLNDAENQPYFEAAFVRLLKATPETIARRNLPGDQWGLDNLINSDGSIAAGHEFTETMLYRSHLGFPDGYLKVGDRLIINGEFGFFDGNPQFVDQEGVLSAEEEFTLLGTDPSLALASFMPATSSFMSSETLENHLVKFFAERLSDNSVRDVEGNTLTIYREGGYYSSVHLPGANGDCIMLTGVQTERAGRSPDRRFRLRDAAFVSSDPETCYPPSSMASASGDFEVNGTVTLTATASDINGVEVSGSAIGAFVEYTNIQGAGYFAGMDLNGDGENGVQTLTFSGLSVSGETNLQFSALFAEDAASDGNEDWDQGDYVLVEYRLDGGSWTNLLAIEMDENEIDGFNGAPRIDTDFDGGGDGTEISAAFAEFAASIPGTGTTLDLRITVALDAGDEDIAFDDVTISSASGILFIEDFEDEVASYSIAPAAAEYSDGSGDFFIRVAPLTQTPLSGAVTSVSFYYLIDGGLATLVGTDTEGGNGWSVDFIPDEAGNYSFYSVATDIHGNTEMAPVYGDTILFIDDADVNPEPTASVQIPMLPWWAMGMLPLMMAWLGVRLAKRQ
ncbi:MAG: DNRLRE domain-containing protein [Pseudomonadales bacterium]|nr:DNRLRE domain-containing protein [Pseudomonadales bacterium]